MMKLVPASYHSKLFSFHLESSKFAQEHQKGVQRCSIHSRYPQNILKILILVLYIKPHITGLKLSCQKTQLSSRLHVCKFSKKSIDLPKFLRPIPGTFLMASSRNTTCPSVTAWHNVRHHACAPKNTTRRLPWLLPRNHQGHLSPYHPAHKATMGHLF